MHRKPDIWLVGSDGRNRVRDSIPVLQLATRTAYDIAELVHGYGLYRAEAQEDIRFYTSLYRKAMNAGVDQRTVWESVAHVRDRLAGKTLDEPNRYAYAVLRNYLGLQKGA